MKAAEFSSMWKTHADVSQLHEFYIASDLGNRLQAARYGYVCLLSPEKKKMSLYPEKLQICLTTQIRFVTNNISTLGMAS